MRRRTVLGIGVAGGASVAVGLSGPVAAASPAPAVGRAEPLHAVPVEGTGLTVSLAPGPAAAVLVHVIRRFHYEIETLHAGDLVADRSGLAVDIRPGAYPAGVTGGFLPHQVVVIRDVVAEAGGQVRWGGDLSTPSEGRFEIVGGASDPRLTALSARLVRGPGPGAGMALPFTPARQKTADAVRRQMR